MIRGLDVSHYQGFPDWPTLTAKYRLSFAAAKCSEGMSYLDSSYTYNRAHIRAAGLKVIAYHFATPSQSSGLRKLARRLTGRPLTTIQSSARAQAARFIAHAGDVDALCLDLEKSSLNQTDTNAWMREFGDALRELAPGVTTIAYLGGYAANGSGQRAVDHFDHWWYPRYPGISTWPTTYPATLVKTNFTGWPVPAIWQFTDSMGGMDANVSNLTLDELFGGSMPTVDEIWAFQLTNAIDGISTAKAATFVTQTHKLATFAARDAAASLAILNGSDAVGLHAFALALAAALPSNPGGGPTAAEIADAVAAKFSTLLGGTA